VYGTWTGSWNGIGTSSFVHGNGFETLTVFDLCPLTSDSWGSDCGSGFDCANTSCDLVTCGRREKQAGRRQRGRREQRITSALQRSMGGTSVQLCSQQPHLATPREL